MTDIEINKRIHEIMGLCWHDWVFQDTAAAGHQGDYHLCSKCRRQGYYEPQGVDFTASWEGFGLMWEFMQKHDEWEEFLIGLWRSKHWVVLGPDELVKVLRDNIQRDKGEIFISYISPRPFAEAMYEFFKESQ